ncbi:MAG: hypothetical protein DBX45_04730 [Oscillospiraceae bacterium]|nr:MAG: hypothetical protein DBX45_04730 [Oscillospiraceae bacterium]
MKKRVISMLLGMLMILSVVLTGCSSGEDGDNIIDVSQSRASAMTITLYSIVEDGTTEKAKQAVQDKLNEITENKYNTHVILKLYTESEYDNVIEKQIATIKADMDLQAKLKAASDVAKKAARSAGFSIASATTTEAAAPETDANGETAAETTAESGAADETKINEYGIADTVYPDEEDGQLDIFLINDYATYKDYVSQGVLAALDDQLTSTSKQLSGYIYPSLLSAAKVGGVTYAIPNNHVIGNYTYMLVNKAVASGLGFNQRSFTSAASLYDTGFIERAASENGILMLNDPVCTLDYATGEDASVIGTLVPTPMPTTTNATFPPAIIYGIPEYKSVLCMKNTYKNSIKYGDLKDYAGQNVITAFVKGTEADAAKYTDDYYVVKVAEPTGTAEEACQAMYAVSAYSVSVQRSMEVVNLLTTDTDVVNLLAYGVDEVNYVFDEANSIINLTDLKPGDENYYRMNPDYAGNQYKRYPSSESDASELATAADNWAAGKAQNLSTIELPYANFVVNTTLVPGYVSQDNMDDEDDDETTEGETTTAAETTEPQVEFMDVASMVTALCRLYDDYNAKIENFSGTNPDTGAAMTISEYVDWIAETVANEKCVSDALNTSNSASITNQYLSYIGN